MKFFLDTANLTEIRTAQEMGILDGVTTNPTLVSRESFESFHSLVHEICEVVDGPVSAEVTATDFEGMMSEARTLAALAENVVIKVPMIPEGVKAIRACFNEGIRTNCTLVFSANQALIAAKAGATLVSPFIGRLDDVGEIGMDLIRQIVMIYDNYGFDTEVLVASVRHPAHVTESALAGADVVTMPFGVFQKLTKHPLTDIGLASFLKDWEKVTNGKE